MTHNLQPHTTHHNAHGGHGGGGHGGGSWGRRWPIAPPYYYPGMVYIEQPLVTSWVDDKPQPAQTEDKTVPPLTKSATAASAATAPAQSIPAWAIALIVFLNVSVLAIGAYAFHNRKNTQNG